MFRNSYQTTVYNTPIFVGYGKSHSSFGEIVQGRLSSGEDFLVTLPIDLWSICNLTCVKRKGPLVINCDLYKSKDVALRLLEKLGITQDVELTISFSRNIPVGKGLSSSTADMLSTVRALQEIFGFLLRNKTISEVFISIEPHDGLMYKSCIIYNHRKGHLIKDLEYIPSYWVVAVDLGGVVDTVSFNHNLNFTPQCSQEYDLLYHDLIESFKNKDDIGIAKCATKSFEIFNNRAKDPFRTKILKTYKDTGAIGLLNTHSGTCVGYIFPKSLSGEEVEQKANLLTEQFDLPVFITGTLRLLN